MMYWYIARVKRLFLLGILQASMLKKQIRMSPWGNSSRKKLDQNISKTTVVSIKKAYIEGMKEKRAMEGDDDLQVLPMKKHGRRVPLGHDLDMKVQLYLRKVRK